MTLTLLINGQPIQNWEVPEWEISTPTLDWETRTKFRIAAVNEWVDKMKRVYSSMIEKSSYPVEFQISFASKANTLDISDEEMKEFELFIIYKQSENV